MEKKLQRIPHEGAVAGVCAGLGAYFGVDKTWVRVAFIVSVFFSGYMGIGLLGPVVYIVLWIVLPIKSFTMPSDPFDVDYRTPPSPPTGTADTYAPNAWGNQYEPDRPKTGFSRDRYVAGGILVVLGIFFLLNQLNVFYWRDFARLWPILIILMGIANIFGAFKQRKPNPFSVNEREGKTPQEQAADSKSDNPADDKGIDNDYTK